MSVRALLCIMNARRIPECIASYEALDADVAWMTGYSVADLRAVHAEIVASTDYDVYLNLSDDCIVSQDAYDAVLAQFDEGHEAATGWCRLHDRSEWANVCHSPLIGDLPARPAYPFYTVDAVRTYPHETVPTHFMGMSLTGMTRDLWRRFPYGCFQHRRLVGHSSDFHLCIRLRDAGVPMVAARSGYVEHVKQRRRAGRAQNPSHRLLVGEVTPAVRIVERAA